MTAFTLITPALNKGSILVEIAHAGTTISKEESVFFETIKDFPFLDADLFLDELYHFSNEKNFLTIISQNVSRYVIDVDQPANQINRLVVDESDSSREEFGFSSTSKGIIPLFNSNSDWLIAKKIPHYEIQRRLKEYYFSYHHSIKNLGNSLRDKNGFLMVINARSMCSRGKSIHRDMGMIRPDIDLQNHNGQTSSKDMIEFSFEFFRSVGLKTTMNSIAFGGFCNQIYGKPQKKTFALQIEINRALYMDEKNFQKYRQNFQELKILLSQYFDQLAGLNFS